MSGEIRVSLFCASRIRRNPHAIGRFDFRGNSGQALVEFAVVIPMLFLLIVLAMNFAGLINAWINVENATRAAADYAILSGDSAGLPTTATSTTLQNLVNAELLALPTPSSPTTICIRENNNYNAVSNPTGLTKLLESPSGACSNYAIPPSEPETIVSGSTVVYADVAVDITYTYTSFFSGSSVMGLPLTVLPSTVHRRTVMRIE